MQINSDKAETTHVVGGDDRAMKVLVLGGTGMLGHKVFQHLTKMGKNTYCTIQGSKAQAYDQYLRELQSPKVIEGVSAMDFEALRNTLVEVCPDVIINCIGIIKQRDAAQSPIPSMKINSFLPHMLAEWSAHWGGRVIHFSTDCVFTGRRGSYSEEDRSDAEDLYGKSKFLGEVQSSNAITLRTSIIGRELNHHQSLLDWFLLQEGKTIDGYTKAIYSGVTTNHLSEVVNWLIDKHPSLSGLFQVVSTPISKYELLCKLKTAYDLNINITPTEGEVCDRSMLGDKFHSVTGYKCDTWDMLVTQLAKDDTPYRSLCSVAQNAKAL